MRDCDSVNAGGQTNGSDARCGESFDREAVSSVNRFATVMMSLERILSTNKRMNDCHNAQGRTRAAL